MAVPATGLKVWDVLDGLRRSVNDTITFEAMKEAGFNPTIEAARDVGLAIGNAFNAYDYQGIWQVAADTVDKTAKGQLKELKSMVEALQSKQIPATLNISSRADQFIDSLALADWQPKLTALCPRFVFIEKDHFKISFSGLFHYVANYNGYVLTLSKGSSITHVSATSTCLSFHVNNLSEDFFSKGAEENYQYIKGNLEVDYSVGMFRRSKRAIYEIWIEIFPLSPGKITLIYPKIDIADVLTQRFRSMTFSLFRKDFADMQIVEREVTVKPTKGWEISSPPTIYAKDFSTPVQRNQWSPSHVDIKFILLQETESFEGHVEFDEMKSVIKETECTQPIALKWGEMFRFTAPKFRIDFKSFEGQEFILTGTDQVIPYLKVVKLEGNNYSLVARFSPNSRP